MVWTDFTVAVAEDDINARRSPMSTSPTSRSMSSPGPSLDLIETVSATIADRINALDGILAVEVTVHKPDVPIHHPFS